MHQCLSFFFALRHRFGKHYDPVRIFYYNYWFYVCSGFWSYDSPIRWKAFFYKCYRRYVIALYVVSMTLFLIDAVMVRNDFGKLSFNMSSSVLLFMKVAEFVMLSHLKENITSMHDRLDNHLHVGTVGHSSDDRRIFRRKARLAVRIMVTFYGLLAVGLPLRVLADTALDTRAYLIPMPFKEKLDPYYPYLYTQQILACFHFMASTLAFDLLQFTLLLRIIAHYEVLEKNISKIKSLYPRTQFELYVFGYTENSSQRRRPRRAFIPEKNNWQSSAKISDESGHKQSSAVKRVEKDNEERRVYQLLKENIRHHQKLCIEIKTFFSTYSQILLVQLGGLLLLIGILTLQVIFLSNRLLSTIFVQQVLYALTTILNIMFLSSFGNELTERSASAANALYDTPWYRMSVDNMKTVCLIIQKLMNAPKLKAGRMYNVDRPMCLKFFQFSYNMVALLKNKM